MSMLTPQMVELVVARHNELLADAAREKLAKQALRRQRSSQWAGLKAHIGTVRRMVIQMMQRALRRQLKPLHTSIACDCIGEF